MSNTCTIDEPLFFIDEYVANGAIRCHAYWDADEAFHDWADFKADSTVPLCRTIQARERYRHVKRGCFSLTRKDNPR